jgi:Uma2 family endonuclease
MGEVALHARLIRYLIDVLICLFQGQVCAIHENLNFYYTRHRRQYPVAPDIAVLKGVPYQDVTSWRIGSSGPAPQVVFEIASDETWHKDLSKKPAIYGYIGVQEYFAYDPHNLPLSEKRGRRLFGWRLNQSTQRMRLLPLGPGGQLWSEQLQSFLVPEEKELRLYDRHGRMRLTLAETEAAARQAEVLRAEAEARRAEAEAMRAEREAAARRLEAQRADAEARRAAVLAEKLRSLGIDPDQLLSI